MSESEKTETSKSIFFLKASSRSLLSAENFLRSRHWDISSSIDLLEAVTIILEKKPQYMLLCTDHPSPKVLQLPKIVAQSMLPIKTILYVEKDSSLNISRMQSLGHPYQLLPPVSGPAIERMILKVQREETQKSRARPASASKEASPSNPISGKMKNALQMFFSSQDEEGSETSSFDPTQFGIEDDGTDFFKSFQQESSNPKSSNMIGAQSSNTSTVLPYASDTDFSPFSKSTSVGDSPNDEHLSSSASINANSLQGTGSTHTADSLSSTRSPRSSAEATPNLGAFRLGQEMSMALHQTLLDSVLIKALDQAFILSANNKKGPSYQQLKVIDSVWCVILETTRFKGYVITALSENQDADSEFFSTLKKHLYDFLREQGESVLENASHFIKIKATVAEKWLPATAPYLKTSIHSGQEVALAFYEKSNVNPEILFEDGKDLLEINVDDLYGDQELNFHLYIFLPANNKFVLLTPKGGIFFSLQKERLMARGVTHMHIRRDEIPEIKVYKARCFLLKSIHSLNEASSIKASIPWPTGS